MATNCNNNPVA
ncbi:hypothetical protein GQ600_22851 [Phytophthora cactorum]|nr:hypothetical protein GQ600_22851 [Phytophthora cactorum]